MAEGKKSRLFLYGTLEPKDPELDERLEKCYGDLSGVMSRLRENELFNHLNDKVSRSGQDHEDVSLALLYAILTEPSSASKTYTTLNLVSRDSLSLVTSQAERIIMEKTSHLQDHARVQVLWLTGEMVKTGVAGADKLCFALLKQLPAGTALPGDVYIAENLMHLLLDNRDWMDAQPGLISSVVYTYLSLLPYHVGPTLTNLKDQETQMCVSLIKTRFAECIQIGRDLLRLLQAVARIPEFTDLWRDLIHHPQTIGPQCMSIAQILSRRTSRRFIAGRILVDVEIKLNFLLAKVKFGQHRKYQEWFQKKYLSTPESLHQIPELIRFICCVIHPTNEVLASDIIPRWALIGWLLSLCQGNPIVYNNAKLSLFYDWLAYNPDADNIMNIEPGILLMHHSLRAHPQITASLLDFLCRMVPNYYPSQEQVVETGMKAALRDILQKGVLHSLEPLFESSRLDEELRQLVKKTLPEFCRQAGRSPAPESQLATPTSMEVLEVGGGVNEKEEDVVLSWGQGGGGSVNDPLVIPANDDLEGEDSEVISAFSDSEEDAEDKKDVSSDLTEQRPSPDFCANNQEFHSISAGWEEGGDSKEGSTSSSTMWSRVDDLPDGLKEKLISLKNESNFEVQVKLLDDVLKLLEDTCQEEAEESQLTINILAAPLSVCLTREFSEGCEREDESGTALTHCLFRMMLTTPPPDSVHPLAVALSSNQPKLGYYYLYYLSKHTPEGSLEPYSVFAEIFEDFSLRECLVKDLKVCVEHEPAVFFHLLPSIYRCFSKHLSGSQDVLYLIVSNVDPAQLHSLIQQLLMKEFQLFGKHPTDIKSLIAREQEIAVLQDDKAGCFLLPVSSLQWDSFEQFCVWQLLSAEGSDPAHIIPILADLNAHDHPEALSSALLYLKNESSGYAAISTLLSLPASLSDLVDAIGSRWLSGRPTKCAKLLSQHLESLEKSDDEYTCESIKKVLFHLQRLIKLMNSKQVLEASEYAVSKTLHKYFKIYSELASDFPDLYKAISSTQGEVPFRKESASHKRPASSSSTSVSTLSSEKSLKHFDQPKPKRRRVTNKEDLIDS